jgi:glycosyltransferase involved in cell wall biosynthesis
MKTVLFFTPHGTLTGSEVLLWNFLKHFDRQKMRAALYAERDGQLVASLPRDIPYFSSPFQRKGVTGIFYKFLRQLSLFSNKKNLMNIHNSLNPDCWYLNTVLMFYLVPLARKIGVKTIIHLNELHSQYECISYADMAAAMQQADLVIGISDHICNLAKTMGAREVLHQDCFVDLANRSMNLDRSAALRIKLGIQPTTFVWLIAGTPTYRKGVDFLVSLASYFKNKSCHFIWMGFAKNTGLTYLVEQQIIELGLTNVSLLPLQTDDYYNYMSCANGFLLLSREEPFGNVIIDAASLGKPIIASAEGGAIEFMRPNMGELVETSNVPQFIYAMEKVIANQHQYDPQLLIRQSYEYSASVQVEQWERKILSIFHE